MDRDGRRSVFASVRMDAKAREAPNRLWPLGSTKKVIGSSGELWPSLHHLQAYILGCLAILYSRRPGCATAREGWAVRNVTRRCTLLGGPHMYKSRPEIGFSADQGRGSAGEMR